MVRVVVDDTLVESKLNDLVNLTTKNGAIFHNEMVIVSVNGDFRIESNLDRSCNDSLIYMPECCLPKIDDFEVALENNKLTFKPKSNHVNSLHIEIFRIAIELFNLTEKIETHKKTFPWLVFFNNADLLEHLHQGRSIANKYYDYFKDGDISNIAIESFFGARHFNYRYNDGLVKAALMPLVELFNHHSDADPYYGTSPDLKMSEGIMVRNSKPLSSTDECFVRYNKADMLSAYMSYGFVDMSTSILRSIPLVIKLSNNIGTIHIHSYASSSDAEKIPAEFEDVRYFFPEIKRTAKNEIQLSHLMILQNDSYDSLRRILKFSLSLMFPEMLKNELKRLVRKSEMEVLESNYNYYNHLDSLLTSKEKKLISPENVLTLKKLIRSQNEKLDSYKKRKL